MDVQGTARNDKIKRSWNGTVILGTERFCTSHGTVWNGTVPSSARNEEFRNGRVPNFHNYFTPTTPINVQTCITEKRP